MIGSTGSSADGPSADGPPAGGLPAGDPAPDQGHRVRRRRRAASRPAGPPTAGPDRQEPTPDPGSASMSAPAPEPAAETADPAAVPDPAASDPVARSDRRRDKKRRNRSERLAAESAAKAADTEVTGAKVSPEPAQRGRRQPSERGLHGLEGNRSTQLPSAEAMLARDWAAPGPADLAAAEAELVIVRRHYRPPEPLPTKGSAAPGQEGRTRSRPAADGPRPKD
ncbi:MAG: hypothetical protein WKF57_15165 [Nakamurella sp.]